MLKGQPEEVRENVKEVCVDMWGGFKKVIDEVFPNALIVIDRFHVMKLVNESQLLDGSPCLSIAHELKEEIRDIYENSTTVKMGIRKLTKW